jgi:hypothetical protein
MCDNPLPQLRKEIAGGSFKMTYVLKGDINKVGDPIVTSEKHPESHLDAQTQG